ncbi:hypothetical protein N806_18320 [Rhodococcus sp. P27]|nr:hypothetical protein N806_18320 [Rhodococcus sp. P27]
MLREFALAECGSDLLPVCEHHCAECRRDQQCAGQFEGPDVADEDEIGESVDVALVESGESGEARDRRISEAADKE